MLSVTSTVPDPEGDVTVTEVGEPTTSRVPGVPPKSTALVPVKPVPEMTTDVPPVGTAADGLTALIVGAAS